MGTPGVRRKYAPRHGSHSRTDVKAGGSPLEAFDVASIPYDDERLAVEGYTFVQVAYHIQLIHAAGLTEPYGGQGMMSLTFSGLTWRGHEFIDSVRDPKVWRDAKTTVEKIGGYTVDIMIGVAKALLKQTLQQHGVPIDL